MKVLEQYERAQVNGARIFNRDFELDSMFWRSHKKFLADLYANAKVPLGIKRLFRIYIGNKNEDTH